MNAVLVTLAQKGQILVWLFAVEETIPVHYSLVRTTFRDINQSGVVTGNISGPSVLQVRA